MEKDFVANLIKHEEEQRIEEELQETLAKLEVYN